MAGKHKIEFGQLEVGCEFPPASCELTPEMINIYLKAVEGTSTLYQGTGLVPPMAIAAYAMVVLSESISLPAGAIHVTQDIEFMDTASMGDTVTSYARVTRKQNRGKLHILNVAIDVLKQNKKAVLAGTMGFILPEYVADNVL